MIVNLVAKKANIRFKVFTEEAFASIATLFADLVEELRRGHANDLVVEQLYIIRLGDHTYSGPSFSEFEKYYKTEYRADHFQMIVQVINTNEHLSPVVARVAVVVDRKSESSLEVIGREANWVNGVFARFDGVLRRVPTRNVVLHHVVFEMLVQLLAVILITVVAIYSAGRISARLSFEFSEVYAFIIVFLFISNLWTYTLRGLTALRSAYYPAVDVIRHPRRPILISVILFFLVSASAWAIGYVLELWFKTS